MIDNLPTYISLAFGLTSLATLLLFIWTIKSSSSKSTQKKAIPIFIGLTFWIIAQSILTLKNSYNSDLDMIPPKIVLIGILPPFFLVCLLFLTKNGLQFIDSLPLKNLMYLNSLRIPVEIVLFCLYLNKAVPEIMTFEGRNFDIFAGISAPLIAYFGFEKKKINPKIILIWNFICLGLLINIIFYAFFSAPTPMQKFAFDQPNIAITHFPFNLLPTFIVPIVLFGHLVSIRQLLRIKTDTKFEL